MTATIKPATNAIVVPIEPVATMLDNNTSPRTIPKLREGLANTSGTNPTNWNTAALLALPAFGEKNKPDGRNIS